MLVKGATGLSGLSNLYFDHAALVTNNIVNIEFDENYYWQNFIILKSDKRWDMIFFIRCEIWSQFESLVENNGVITTKNLHKPKQLGIGNIALWSNW